MMGSMGRYPSLLIFALINTLISFSSLPVEGGQTYKNSELKTASHCILFPFIRQSQKLQDPSIHMFDWSCAQVSFLVTGPHFVEIEINPAFNSIGIELHTCASELEAASQSCTNLCTYQLFSSTWNFMSRLQVYPPLPNADLKKCNSREWTVGRNELLLVNIVKLTEGLYPYMPWFLPNGIVEMRDVVYHDGQNCKKPIPNTKHLIVVGDSSSTGYGIGGSSGIWGDFRCLIGGLSYIENCSNAWPYLLSRKLKMDLELIAVSRTGVSNNPKLLGVIPLPTARRNRHIGYYWDRSLANYSPFNQIPTFAPYKNSLHRFLVIVYVGNEDFRDGEPSEIEVQKFKTNYFTLLKNIVSSLGEHRKKRIHQKSTSSHARILILCGGSKDYQQLSCKHIEDTYRDFIEELSSVEDPVSPTVEDVK